MHVGGRLCGTLYVSRTLDCWAAPRGPTYPGPTCSVVVCGAPGHPSCLGPRARGCMGCTGTSRQAVPVGWGQRPSLRRRCCRCQPARHGGRKEAR
jgi:hypothetical protein